jgi:hypothetical protein
MRSLLLLLVAACEHGQTPIETALISPLRVPCQGFEPTMCLEMQPDQQPVERVFFGIDGFSHRWGIEAEITLRREQLEPIPDGPSENLIMLELIVENPRDVSPFDLDFPFGGGWLTGTTSPLDLHGTSVTCEATLCTEIRNADLNGQQYRVTFDVVGDQALNATAIVPF